MKHGSKMVSSKNALFLCSLYLLFVEIRSNPLLAETETVHSQNTPQGKQGILEIPKQAATVIRNFIDSSIKHYFNITTPTPLDNVPPELKDSIVGNFLLGNLYSPLAPAPVYNPAVLNNQPEVKPIAISNEPSFAGHVQFVEPTTVSPSGELSSDTSTKKPRVKPSRSPDKVHVLNTDTSLSGIYNSYGLQINGGPDGASSASGKPTSSQAIKAPNVIPNQSYGLLVNNSPGDEVYWIPDATRPSVVIPIQTSTTPRSETINEPEQTTEAVEVTTEDEEEEGIGEEEEVEAFRRKY